MDALKDNSNHHPRVSSYNLGSSSCLSLNCTGYVNTYEEVFGSEQSRGKKRTKSQQSRNEKKRSQVKTHPEALNCASKNSQFAYQYEEAIDHRLQAIETFDNNDTESHYRAMETIGKQKLYQLKKYDEEIKHMFESQNYVDCLECVDRALQISVACEDYHLLKMRLCVILGRSTEEYTQQYGGKNVLDIFSLYYQDDLTSFMISAVEMLKWLPKKSLVIDELYNNANRFINDVNRAQKLYSANAFDEASNLLKNLLILDPSNKAVSKRLRLHLANLEIEMGQISKSIDHLCTVLDIHLMSAEPLNVRAKCCVKHILLAFESVDVDEFYYMAYLLVIDIFINLNEIIEAESLIDSSRSHSTLYDKQLKLEKLKAYNAKIDKFYNENNHLECLKYLNNAMTIAKSCPNFENLKAECLVMTEQFDEADAIIEEGLKDPNRYYLVYVQGLKAYFKGDFRESAFKFEDVLRKDPNFTRALEFRHKAKQILVFESFGHIAFESQNYSQAMEFYSKALLIDTSHKSNSKLFFYRGVIKKYLNCLNDAYDDFTEALKIDKNRIDALFCRGLVHYELKEYEDCLIDFEELLKLQPHCIDAVMKIKDAKEKLRGLRVRSNYEVLNISPYASASEIKKAFRKLSLMYHSDKNPNATSIDQRKLARKFQEIKQAYDSLQRR